MPISTEIEYASLEELYLDPMNPRLGRSNMPQDLGQNEVLDLMRDFTLDELAVSYLESGGFWTFEAMLVVKEELYGEPHLVVIEGNRRLAALKCLHAAHKGDPFSQKWRNIIEGASLPPKLFTEIPYFRIDSRKEVEAFLGFRHVTGIKEWKPAEKAAFIAKLIDDRGMGYKEVMRMIGSKTPTVRRHYISYRLLLQMEDSIDDFPREKVQDRFSVMYLTLRTRGAQQYLQIDILADPEAARMPVPKSHLGALAHFALWLFGNESQPPFFTDSRQVDNFGLILQSGEATQYLERTKRPHFDIALRMAGGDEPEIVTLIEGAADNVELSLTRVHFHSKSDAVQRAVRRLGANVKQLLNIFPSIRDELQEKEV